jgi:hypothetical protein
MTVGVIVFSRRASGTLNAGAGAGAGEFGAGELGKVELGAGDLATAGLGAVVVLMANDSLKPRSAARLPAEAPEQEAWKRKRSREDPWCSPMAHRSGGFGRLQFSQPLVVHFQFQVVS